MADFYRNIPATVDDPQQHDLDMNGNDINNVNAICFVTDPTHVQQEGCIHWDNDDKTLNIDTEVTGTRIQVGQEQVVRATNKTGATLANGTVVYINGSQGNRPTIAKADATDTGVAMSTIGIVTNAIDNNATGYVTTFGLVRDLDTSSFSEGDVLYLSTTAGEFTATAPEYPNALVVVGVVVNSHISEGSLLFRVIFDSDYTLRTDWDQNGFVNRSLSTLTWTDSTPDRALSVQPTGTDFDYVIAGTKYTTTGDTVQITDVEGIHVIYYDGDTLTTLANPTDGQISQLIRTKCLVSIVYWDTSASEAIYVGEERHGKNMSHETHAYLHFAEGLRYISGLGLNTINADGAGATADAQFGVDSGDVADEDLYLSISAVTSTTGLPIYYMTGASADWNRYIEAGFSVRTLDGTSADRLAYNQFTGGAWQLTEVTNNGYVHCHVFATTEKDKPMIAIMGQNQYLTKPAAQAAALTEIQSLVLNDLPLPEIRPIATVIFQTNTSYANAVNGKIISTNEGDDYVDWRSETISRVEVSTTDHNQLTGLGVDSHTQYILADGSRAFTAYPNIGPTASPASNATGTAGQIAWDSSYFYVCTGTNTWTRVALTGGY